jgi:hypothetical protein
MRRPVGVNPFFCNWDKFIFYPIWTWFFARRAAFVATLPSALDVSVRSLGASWVFWIQPVLPPVVATFHSISQMECWARPMTQSPELGL